MTFRCYANAAPLHLLFAVTILLKATLGMTQTSSPDFSERLDKLWNYDKPAESETRFRAELTKHSAGSREGWAASLNRNIGWPHFDAGDSETARVHWKKAPPLHEVARLKRLAELGGNAAVAK